MTTDDTTKEQTANTAAPTVPAANSASEKPTETAPKEGPKAKKPAAIKEAKPTKEANDGKEPKAAPKALMPAPKKVAPKEPKAAKAAKAAKPPKAKKAEPRPLKSPKAEPIKRPTNGKYARHPKNPFREGSSYALAFDILAANRKGMNRADLTKEYSRVSKKPLKNAGYDIAVLLSPKSEKPTSERHRSCRDGFGIRKENSFVQIILPGKE